MLLIAGGRGEPGELGSCRGSPGSPRPSKAQGSWVRGCGCLFLEAFAGKELAESQAPGAEWFAQAGKLLVLLQRGLGTGQAVMLPWPWDASLSSRPRSQGCRPSQREGNTASNTKKCTFWGRTALRKFGHDATPGRASLLHTLPRAAGTTARPGHLRSGKPWDPQRLGLCRAPPASPLTAGAGRGCRRHSGRSQTESK